MYQSNYYRYNTARIQAIKRGKRLVLLQRLNGLLLDIIAGVSLAIFLVYFFLA